MSLIPLVFITAAIAVLPACVTAQQPQALSAPVKSPLQDISSHFKDLDGCFMLYDIKRNELLAMFNKKACKTRQPACSTFEAPLAIMAFDSGVHWDGELKDLEATTRQLGRAKIQSYLKAFNYGNQDFSGGLDDAWLTPTPYQKKKTKTTVRISAFDQIDFIKNLWTSQLPVGKHSMELAQKLIPSENSPAGFTLQGNMGSGFLGRHSEQRLGWYTAHLAGHEQEYAAVVVFTDRRRSDANLPAGQQAMDIMKAILSDRAVW